MESLILLVSLVIFILLGAPIGFVLAAVPTTYILLTDTAPMATVPLQMYQALANTPLVAIPFFILTGELMNTLTITDRLLELSKQIVGRLRGGLAQVNILTSMLFAGMNGSVVADTATVGAILIPAMKRSGYSPAFSAAITTVSSTIGGIIPPSVTMIILATAAQLSVGALFAGGILPGILIAAALMILTYLISVRRGYERSDEPFSISATLRALWGASFALLIPIVLVGGIVGGIFSSVEAGAITAFTAFLIGAIVYRSFTINGFTQAFLRATKMSASVFLIIAAAGPFSWLLTRLGTLQLVTDWLAGYADQPILFAIVLTLFIFAIGMVMDAVANTIILGPPLIAVCALAGIPTVQAALIVVVGFIIGTVTPPVGTAYFIGTRIAEAKLEHVAVAMMPFILVEVVVLFLMFAIPSLTMWLPIAFGFVD